MGGFGAAEAQDRALELEARAIRLDASVLRINASLAGLRGRLMHLQTSQDSIEAMFRAARRTLNGRAYMEAARTGTWDVATDAANGLAYVVGDKQARHAEGKIWAEHARVATAHAGDPVGFREAWTLNTLGIVHFSLGAYEEAKAL